jgi:hypothetical protein
MIVLFRVFLVEDSGGWVFLLGKALWRARDLSAACSEREPRGDA